MIALQTFHDSNSINTQINILTDGNKKTGQKKNDLQLELWDKITSHTKVK